MAEVISQETINELVERFYDKLTKDGYFRTMFKERNVDIELLKSRQRKFLMRLINEDSSKDQHKHAQQVVDRHPFKTTPERAVIWTNTLEETLNEMDINPSIKQSLLEKIRYLMNKITE